MYLVTYPDYLEKDITVILHNVDEDYKKILLPMLFDNLPDDSVIAISHNQFDWAMQFQNSYWFFQNNVVDSIISSHQYNITSVDLIPEHCRELFSKINI